MHRFWLCILTVLLLSGFSPGVLKAQEKVSEIDVKAAFVYNFAKFVEWPASVFAQSDSTFRIGIVGKSEINQALLAAVNGKTVAGRTVVVMQSDGAEALAGCHIVFFNRLLPAALQKSLQELEGHSVLTVGDQEEFIAQGGMIRFFIAGEKVRFEISPTNVRAEKIEISSKVLKLATIANAHGGTE